MTVPGTTPYAWPFDGSLAAERIALVVAGCQAGWAERVPDPQLRADLRALATALIGLGGLVVRVRHLTPSAGDPWVQIPAHLDVRAGGLDGFYASSLDRDLRRADRPLLALAGFGLEGPVHSTLRSANDRGYECLTLRDACGVLEPACEHAAYSTIEMSGGIFGAVGTSAALLQALRATRPKEVG